jgi:hypothetical protein
MKAWAFVFGALFGGALLASACGSGATSNTFGDLDAGAKPDVTLMEAGSLNTGEASTISCTPLTCQRLGYTCGQTGNGCGGMIDCGTCSANETCGGGGKFSVCGGSGPCKPKSCSDLKATCGPQGDGCGNVIQCGSCKSPDICGGGGEPSQCGSNGAPHPDGGLDGGPCVPETCMSQHTTCGPVGDGCGNVLQCGACSNPGDTCGGGGTNGACGQPVKCVSKSCSDQGITCGPAGDGCGNLLQCGSCMSPDICGGGGVPGVCGDSVPCTNLCLAQKICGAMNTTTLTGTVVAGTLPAYIPAGKGPDPIPNVVVYVPNTTPAAFTKGVTCNACGADVTGDPITETTTDYQGNFTLTNVPVPASGVIPIVIQLGKWRRIFGLGNTNNPGIKVTQCTGNNAGQLRMPRTKAEGDIPLTAISTGEIDPMECVLLKMGVDQSEFTDPGVGGRIEMYAGNGATVDGFTPDETKLVPNAHNSTGTLDQYDQVLFPCWADDPLSAGSQNVKTSNQQQNVVSYTNAGGRMFATHLSYSWLEFAGATPFNTTATWTGDPPVGGTPDLEYNTGTATIQQGTSADTLTFFKWMNALAWSNATNGAFSIAQERNNFSAIGAGSQLWIQGSNAAPTISNGAGNWPTSFPLVYTFATPYSTAATPPTQCGKVIYSDFHVSVINGGSQDDQGFTFPDECTSAPMSAQEKALEYLIWDLASCLPGPPGPSCTPTTCMAVGATCGPIGDGCGGELMCGSCTGCQTCGGGGTPSVCGGECCQKLTCVGQNIECGPAGDGCGGSLDCGSCSAGLTCGGGGHNGHCGSLDAGPTCQALSCKEQNITCGPAGDGCGNEIQCGTCPKGAECGAGGVPGQCAPVCQPKTCQELGVGCGPTGNGCGGELQCGTCKLPETCGGGGKASVCGGSSSK